MSKWSRFKHKYPNLLYDEAKEQAILEVLPYPSETLADQINAHEDEIEKLRDQLAELEFQLEIREQALLRQMEKIGTDRLHLSGYSWSDSPEPYPTVVDRAAVRDWAIARGDEDLLTVHWGTLKALTKEALEQNKKIPSGVEVFIKHKLSRRKRG